MSRIRVFFQKKRKSKYKILTNIRRKGYKNKLSTVKEKIIFELNDVINDISYVCIKSDKMNKDPYESLNKIREILSRVNYN